VKTHLEERLDSKSALPVLPGQKEVKPGSHKPRIVLVYGPLRTGGIETLIVRVSNFLARNGREVTVICGDGALLPSISPGVQRIIYSDTRDLKRQLRDRSITSGLANGLIIVSFDPISAARGLSIESTIPRSCNVTHLSGVFHPRAYFMTGERQDRVLLNHLVASVIGYARLFFMNEECRLSHARKWHANLGVSPIVPLPVDAINEPWTPPDLTVLKIISVGRLVDFKAYNLGASQVASECLARGIEIAWDIYGDGPLAGRIQEEIRSHSMEGIVTLKGELPYEQFTSTIAGYDLFIGMGTAAIEAAMIGLPSICATESQRTLSYGYLHQLPYGNVGELQEAPPARMFADLIEEFAGSNRLLRANLSRECRAAALKYDMDAFVRQVLDVNQLPDFPRRGLRKRFVGWIYYALTESWVPRFVRRTRATYERLRRA